MYPQMEVKVITHRIKPKLFPHIVIFYFEIDWR